MKSTAIRRKERFTQIANKCLNDTRLSLQAKGLMAVMMSNAEEWDFYLTEIVKRSTNGLDSTRRALHELEEFGYLIRYRKRDPKTGQLKEVIWSFDDEAHVPDVPDHMGNLTKIGFSNVGKTYVGKSNTNNTNSKNKNSKNTLSKSKEKSKKNAKILKKNDFDFLAFVEEIRSFLRPKGNNYPTLSLPDGRQIGLNSANKLYDKSTSETLSSFDAMSIYQRLYKHKEAVLKQIKEDFKGGSS